MFIIMMVGALMALSVAMSTREQRAEARAKFKPFGRIAGVVALVLWAVIAWPLIRH